MKTTTKFSTAMIATASVKVLHEMLDHAAYHAESFAEQAADEMDDVTLARLRAEARKYSTITSLLIDRLRALGERV